MKVASVCAFVVFACAASAQVYQMAPGSTENTRPKKEGSLTPSQSLGWGSNIQNARLARAAQLALQRGDHALALNYAQRAAQAAPNDPQLWFLFGYAARLSGDYRESVDAYTHGLRISPSAPDGLSGLAQDYSLMGRTEDAERLLKQVLSSAPKDRGDLLLLGELYMRSRDYADALAVLNGAEKLQPEARSEMLLALCYQQLKQLDLTSRYLAMAEQRAPDNPDVERSLAGYYRDLGEYAEAIAALKTILKPKPEVTAELAYTYQLDGKMDDSAKFYAQAADAEPRNLDMQLAAAQAQVAAGFMGAADSFLKRAATLSGHDYRLHAIMGEIAQSEERDQDAVVQYNAALAALPGNPVEGPLYGIQLRMDLVSLYQSLADPGAAHRELQIAQSAIKTIDDSGPNPGGYLRLRASIELNTGDFDDALADVSGALAADHLNRDDLQLDGDVLMKLGRTDEAIAVYKQILSGDSRNRAALVSLGYASRAAGREKDAESTFRKLAQNDASWYVPYLALGDLYTAGSEYQQAQASYSKAYKLAPRNALIVAGGMNAGIESHDLNLARQWMTRVSDSMKHEPHVLREEERYLSFEGRYRESAEYGEEAMKELPRDRDVVVYLGYDLLHLGEYDKLLSLTNKYLIVLPKEPDIPLLEGYVHKHEGLNREAFADFTEALQRDPSVVTAYVNLGYVLNDLHQSGEAAADFESALKREPGNGEAHLGLAYADLELHKPEAAVRQTELAEQTEGDIRDIHVIRATAYGREDRLAKAAVEYEAALKFTPDDGALHLGLGTALFSEQRYRDAIDELQAAQRLSPRNAEADAMLARAYANLHERDQALRCVQLAEEHAGQSASAAISASELSGILVSTGEALSTLGDQHAAMDRFRKALVDSNSDRVGVRLAIAQVMVQQGHSQDAERQIALAWMEAEAGDTAPPTGAQYIAAADIFRSLHGYEVSQSYLGRAKSAGAPDKQIRIGLAENDLALGETAKAHAELAAIGPADNAPDYQYLVTEANVFRQEHQDAKALTAFAQAANAAGDDQSAEQNMLLTGANVGLRVTPDMSVLSDFTLGSIFEDTAVYVLDSKLDGPSPVASSDIALLPPPRSSVQTQWTDAFHLQLGHLPTASGFFQLRNARGLISVPSTSSIVNRNTTDSTFNIGLNPTIHLGDNTFTFDSGVQGTLRRDSIDPVDMNQNLLRLFTYMTTSSFFNAVSASGYVLRETGPFTENGQHSRALAGAIDFRVGAPWGKTALLTGWAAEDQKFTPAHIEDYYTSSYIGLEHRFSPRLNATALVEYLRALRVFQTRAGIAQDLRPAGGIDFMPKPNWDVQFSTAYFNNRGFHTYDAVQNSFSVSYSRPFQRKFNDGSGAVPVKYPIRFSAGWQQESFFNFSGSQSEQYRPYVEISLF